MNWVVGLFIGVVVGLIGAAAIGVLVVNLILPWEDICAAIGPMQQVAESGSRLITDLQSWLTQVQDLLSQRPSASGEEARSGLSGLLDRATDVAGDVASTALDIMTAPLEALIALAQATLAATQDAVDAARNAVAAVDQARCE